MNRDQVECCIAEYSEMRAIYRRLADETQYLLRKLIKQRGIEVHSIQAREKDPNRLREKLSRPEAPYRSLSDVSDLAGVRVITYFSDHVDRVLQAVESEFEVLKLEDRREPAEPDKFGYTSVQCDCKWSAGRLMLTENKEYEDKVVEIQIRTILEHAWAEVEHDLGYKPEERLPTEVRRRFSELKARLESVDRDFVDIRNRIQRYVGDVRRGVAAERRAVRINEDSVEALLRREALVQELDGQISAIASGSVAPIRPEDLELLAAMLNYVGLPDVSATLSALQQRKDQVIELGRIRLGGKARGSIYAGMSLFYLSLITLAENGTLESVLEGLDHFLIAHPKERHAFAELLVREFGQASC